MKKNNILQPKRMKKGIESKWMFYSVLLVAAGMIALNILNYIVSYS